MLSLDSIPCVVVSPGPEGERTIFETFDNGSSNIVYGYPVNTIIVTRGETTTTNEPNASSTAADTDLNVHMYLREVVRNLMHVTRLSGVSSVFNGDIEAAPPFVMAGSNTMLYQVSAIKGTYWSAETNTG